MNVTDVFMHTHGRRSGIFSPFPPNLFAQLVGMMRIHERRPGALGLYAFLYFTFLFPIGRVCMRRGYVLEQLKGWIWRDGHGGESEAWGKGGLKDSRHARGSLPWWI